MSNGMKELLDRIAKLRVLIIGDVMLDHYIWGDATRISPEAPVPVVEIARDSYAAGGAANVALNFTALGGRSEICGWIGDDEAGRMLRRILEERGVFFDIGCFPPSGSTILKTRVIVQHQQLCRLDREGRPDEYCFDMERCFPSLREKIDAVDAVIFSDYAKGFISERLVQEVIEVARELGTPVAIDPKPKRELRFTGPDLLTPNRKEALEMAGIYHDSRNPFPAEQVCQAIWERFRPKNLVVTLGEDGMLLSREGQVVRQIPTATREVYDVSGAGDTVVATLAGALAAGADLEQAAHLANAAAGVVVGKLGTATASPEEILASLESQALVE
jgi:D-glycero-beta-D-manno-heptose-7-phosphate kinase